MFSIDKKKRISITISPLVELMLSRASESLGKSKSFLVEKSLEELLERQLEKDAKALAQMKFEDLPSEDEWNSIQSSV